MCTHIRIHTHTCTHTHIHGSVSLEISNRWGMNQWGSRLHMKSRKQLNHWVSMSWRHCASTLPELQMLLYPSQSWSWVRLPGWWQGCEVVILLSILNTEHCDLEKLSHLVKPQNWACGARIQTHICMTPKSTQSFHIITPLIYSYNAMKVKRGGFRKHGVGHNVKCFKKVKERRLNWEQLPPLPWSKIQPPTKGVPTVFQNKRMSHPFVMERRHLQEFLLEEPSWKFHH